MNLSELCIRRPVFATVLSLVVLLVGLMAYSRLPVREYPNIDEPVVSVTTDYRGASPRSSKARSRSRSRRSLVRHRGHRLDDLESRAERSQITVRFRIDRNPDAAAADVRDRVGAGAQAPARRGRRAGDRQGRGRRPADHLSGALVATGMSPLEVTDYADRFVKDRLQNLPGVAEVRIFGERRSGDADLARPRCGSPPTA